MITGTRRWVGTWVARALFLALLFLTLAPSGVPSVARAAPHSTGAKVRSVLQQQPGTTVNVELILDSSGSMDQDVGGGETRMQAAKRVMKDVIAAIPVQTG